MEPHKKLNQDTLHEIDKSFKPCPTLYVRLAMVNREFYELFTSDAMWKKFDVYNKRTGIYQHFRESIRGYEGVMLLLCQGKAGPDCPIPDIEGQKYFLFFKHLRNGDISNDTYSTRELRLLLRVNPATFLRFPNVHAGNRELALYACERDLRNLSKVSLQLCREEDFVKECIQMHANQIDKINPFRKAEIFRARVGPLLDKWLWEVAPAFYMTIWFMQQRIGYDLVDRNPFHLISDRQTVLAALKGNALYLNLFPEYSNDLDVVLASLSPPVLSEAMYRLLRNHDNDELVTAVLSEHPYLLYAAPDRFRRTKEAFLRYIDGLEYMKMIEGRDIAYRSSKFFDWVPDSFWQDAKIAGRAVDALGFAFCAVMGKYGKSHFLKSHFSNFEWAKERVEHHPPMFKHVRGRFKYSLLLECATKSLGLFSDAPRYLRAINCAIGTPDPSARLRKDYPKLKELVLNRCRLQCLGRNESTFEVIKAKLTVNLLENNQSFWLRGLGIPIVGNEEVEMIRSELLHEYVQDPMNLAHLRTLKFTLHWLWDNAATVNFALTFLGPRPPEIGVEEFATLDENFFYPAPVNRVQYYRMPVEDAVRLVRWNPHFYPYLSRELQEHQEVQRAVGRLRKYTCASSACNKAPLCYHHIPVIGLKADDS